VKYLFFFLLIYFRQHIFLTFFFFLLNIYLHWYNIQIVEIGEIIGQHIVEEIDVYLCNEWNLLS